MNTYQSYRNLPSLAGICSMEAAMKPGLSVEECVRRLKRCRFALIEIDEAINYGKKAATQLVDAATRQRLSNWLQLLDDCLAAAGGLSGTAERVVKSIERKHSAKPFKFDAFPKRDERFPDPYNMGVNAEVFLYDDKFPPEPK